MPAQAAEHDHWQNRTALPIPEDPFEGDMRVPQPITPRLMSDHSRNDAVMPANVVLKTFLGIREHSGIKVYGGAIVHPKTSRFEHVIPDEIIQPEAALRGNVRGQRIFLRRQTL